ncbi:Ig-like domain-containing protein, partial [Desulfobacter vibrioformis]|uniref:Ig-like domain-containing protein n=1 Tax=Desulfobacter vibrioformis TaxID=34031 RepID=UPI0012EB97DB
MTENINVTNPIGSVISLTGQAQATNSDGTRPLSIGSDIFKGDTIVTFEGSQLQIDFEDETSLSQGADSQSTISSYIYNPSNASASTLLFEMTKGVFRTVTGEIADQNPDNFKLKSPLALIGIRGTVVNCDIQDGFESIGVESIGVGHIVVVQDAMGNIAFISDPLQIFDIIQNQPLGSSRDMTRHELNNFQRLAPNTIDLDSNYQHELNLRLDAAQAAAEAEQAEVAANAALEKADQEAAEAEAAAQAQAESEADAEAAAQAVEEAQAALEEAQAADDAAAIAIAEVRLDAAAEAARLAAVEADAAAMTAQKELQDAQLARQDAQATLELKIIKMAEAESLYASLDQAPKGLEPNGEIDGITNQNSNNNTDTVVGLLEVNELGDINFYEADTENQSKREDSSEGQAEPDTTTQTNTAPVANNDTASVGEDGSIIVNVLGNDTDGEGDAMTVVSVTNASNGTVFLNEDNTILYTPDRDFNGTDSFTYTVSDGNGGLNTAVVTLSVNPVNDVPMAVDDIAVTDEDTPVIIDVLANDTDADGDSLGVQRVDNVSYGSVLINDDSSLTYTPASDFTGTDTFTYTVSDGNGGTDTATVTVTVNAVNYPPIAADDSAVTDEDHSVTIAVLKNDSDPDGDTLSISSVGTPSHGDAA